MTRRIRHSYFVVMQDFGNYGLEAVVQPEITRREVVSRIKSGEYRNIAFIHHVDGLDIEDVTAELIDAAELELKEEWRDRRATAADLVMNSLHQANERQAAAWDHNRKLRAEGDR